MIKAKKLVAKKNHCRLHLVWGFTLLELIVTMGIISILVVMGIPAFNSYAKHNATKIASQDIKNTLIEAQSLAQSPDSSHKGSDFYYLKINYSQDQERNNGKLELGRGKFGSSRVVDEMRIIKDFRIDSSAWIEDIAPQDLSVQDSTVTYYFLIPSGRILFNRLEPSPGLGYSPFCQPTIVSNCHYNRPVYRQSKIQVRPKDTRDSSSQEPGDQLIVIDGHGGSVDIFDEFVNLR